MARPALSASRSIAIIEFLATFPQRGFTLSEIAKATGVNIASCHAVLTVLADRGYLSRSDDSKSYRLGPSLIAVGQAAIKGQPLVARAKRAAEQLLDELGIPVLLSTVVGDEILAVSVIEDAAGRDPGMRIGERLPLMAPIGIPFLAWAPEEAVQNWIARRQKTIDKKLTRELMRDLELTRERGFQVAIRSASGPSIASLMSDMAARRKITDYKDEVARLVNSFDHHMFQPQRIVDSEVYDVLLIAAPVFDQDGHAVFNLCLGGFHEPLTGIALNTYAERLMRRCIEVMRADRTPSRQRGSRPSLDKEA